MTLYTEDHVLMLEKGDLSCEDFEAALCDYADGDLPRSLKAKIDDHACRCEHCAEMKKTYLLTVKVAALLRDETPADCGVQNRLREALNKRLNLVIPSISAEELLN